MLPTNVPLGNNCKSLHWSFGWNHLHHMVTHCKVIFTFPLLSSVHVLFLCFYALHFLHPKFHIDLVFFFFPTFSCLLSLSQTHCFGWLSLSRCGCFVAKLELAVSVSSSVQAPAPVATHTQGLLQVPQPSSLPLGLLAGVCARVTCQSVRPGILLTFPFWLISHVCSISNICIKLWPIQQVEQGLIKSASTIIIIDNMWIKTFKGIDSKTAIWLIKCWYLFLLTFLWL